MGNLNYKLSELPSILTFRLNNLELCILVRDIVSIEKCGISELHTTKLQNGSIRFNEVMYKAINLYDIFNLSPLFNDSKFLYIMYCKMESQNICFFMKDVLEFISLDNEFIKNNFIFSTNKANEDFVLSQIEYEGRKIIYPDYNKILNNLDKILERTNS